VNWTESRLCSNKAKEIGSIQQVLLRKASQQKVKQYDDKLLNMAPGLSLVRHWQSQSLFQLAGHTTGS
jgi:hypothetical protein